MFHSLPLVLAEDSSTYSDIPFFNCLGPCQALHVLKIKQAI